MPTERLEGLATNWDQKGEGPPVLFLHCAQGSMGAWRGVVAGLEHKYHCLMADSPGHGRSDYDPSQEYQLQAANAMIALLDREVGGPTTLVGHSYGGTIAFRIAQMRPDLVAAMALYEPVNFGLLRDANLPDPPSPLLEAEEFAQSFADEDWDLAARIFLNYWEPNLVWDELPERAQSNLVRTIPFIKYQDTSINGPAHLRVNLSDIKKMDVPVLISHGAETREGAIRVCELIAREMPNATLKSLAGAGHMAPIKSAPAFTEMLSNWLETLD